MNSIKITSFLVLIIATLSSAFAPSSSIIAKTTPINVIESSSTKLYFFGQPKDDGSPGDYVCKVS